jgi:cell division protein FtsL
MVSRTSHASGGLLDQLPRGTIPVAFGAALIGLAITFGTSTLDIYRLEREAAELTRTKQQLQEQRAILHEEIKALHTPAYLERLAREQLGLVKPGEIAVFILHPPPPPPVPVVVPAEHVSWGTRLVAIVAQIFRHAAARFH